MIQWTKFLSEYCFAPFRFPFSFSNEIVPKSICHTYLGTGVKCGYVSKSQIHLLKWCLFWSFLISYLNLVFASWYKAFYVKNGSFMLIIWERIARHAWWEWENVQLQTLNAIFYYCTCVKCTASVFCTLEKFMYNYVSVTLWINDISKLFATVATKLLPPWYWDPCQVSMYLICWLSSN